jgi:hypothetical protein
MLLAARTIANLASVDATNACIQTAIDITQTSKLTAKPCRRPKL